MKKRIRCAGLITINGKIALMHRQNVLPDPNDPSKPHGEYYVFPGGGLEDGEDIAKATEREILEELGITVKAKEELARIDITPVYEEVLTVCEYISGDFATGEGPEFSGDPAYKHRGSYEPVLVSPEELSKIRILPEIFRERAERAMKNICGGCAAMKSKRCLQ